MRFQSADEEKPAGSAVRTAQLVKVASLRAEIQELKTLVSAIDARSATLSSEIEALMEVRKQKQDFPSYRDVNVKRHLLKRTRELSKTIVSRIAEARAELADEDGSAQAAGEQG